MRWPWVSRALHEAELARVEALCEVQRRVQDANMARERELHDAARAEIRSLTAALGEAIKPAPRSLASTPPALQPEVIAQIKASARGDDALARLLTDRARQMRAARPDVTGAQLAHAIKFAEPLPEPSEVAQ